MKQLLFLISILFSVSVFSQGEFDATGRLKPSGAYGITWNNEQKGGIHRYRDTIQINIYLNDSFPARRDTGMMVYTTIDSSYWRWTGSQWSFLFKAGEVGNQTLQQVTTNGDSTSKRIVTSGQSKALYFQAADTADAWTYDSVYFFGNSITAGLGATPQGVYSYSHLYALRAGAIEMNYGIGSTMLVNRANDGTSFEERYRAELPIWSSGKRTLLLGYGVNDVLSGIYPIDTAQFRTVYGKILDTAIIGRNIPAGKIVCWLPYYNNNTDSFVNIIISQVAASRGCAFVNVRDSFRLAGGISLFVDHVHPNNKGAAVIARALINGYTTPTTNYTAINQSALIGGNLYVGRNIQGGTAPGGLGLIGSRFLYGPGRITSYSDHYFSRYAYVDSIKLGANDAFAGTAGPVPYIDFGQKFSSVAVTRNNAYLKFPANAGIGVSSNAVGGMTFVAGSLIRFVFTGADLNADRNLNVSQGATFGTALTGAVTTPYRITLGSSFANAPVSKSNLKFWVFDSTGIGVDATNGMVLLSNAGGGRITSANNHYFTGSIFGNNINMGTRGAVSTATPLTLDMGDTYSDDINRPSKAKIKLFGNTDANTIGWGITTAGGMEFFGGTPNVCTFRSNIKKGPPVGSISTDTTFSMWRSTDSIEYRLGKTATLAMLGALSYSTLDTSGANVSALTRIDRMRNTIRDSLANRLFNYVDIPSNQTVTGKKTYSDTIKATTLTATGDLVASGNVLGTIFRASSHFYFPGAINGFGIGLRTTDPSSASAFFYQSLQQNRAGIVALLQDIRDSIGYTGKTVLVTSASYTAASDVLMVWINYTGGTHSFTLPSASSLPNKKYIIKNLSASNNVTLTNIAAGETGSLNPRGFITVASDGSNWYQIQ